MKSRSNVFSIVAQKFMIPWSIKSLSCLPTKNAPIFADTKLKWTAELDLLAYETCMGGVAVVAVVAVSVGGATYILGGDACHWQATEYQNQRLM